MLTEPNIADCENFKTAYRAISGEADIPELSQDYIGKCLDNMMEVGLI